MRPQHRKLYVICVHYGDPAQTKQAVASLSRGSRTPDRIIVVDHAVEPLSIEGFEHVRVIRPEKNGGYGGGINIGLGALFVDTPAATDIVVGMNCDVRVGSEALELLLKWWNHRDGLALVGPRAGVVDLLSGRAELVMHTKAQRLELKGRYKPYIHGAWFAAPWQLFMKLGAFPERLFLYWEDVSFSWSAAKLGAALWVVPEIKIFHDEKLSEPVSDQRQYYLVRNGARVLETETSAGIRQLWWLYNRARLLYHQRSGSQAAVRTGLADAVQGNLGRRDVTL